jgi:MFS family permease
MRVNVAETPSFTHLQSERGSVNRPLVELFRQHTKVLLLASGVGYGFYVIFYVLLVFIASYTTAELGMPASVTLTGIAVGSVITFIGAPIVGALSDRIGRRLPIITGAGLLALFVFPFFALITTAVPGLVILAYAIAFLLLAIYFGPITTFAAELFPTQVRYSAGALAAQIGAVLGGGLAPLISTLIMTAAGGEWWPVAVYISLSLLLSVVCTLVLRETNGTDMDSASEARVETEASEAAETSATNA